MKNIKNFIWFIKESPKFMNKSLIQLLLHQQLIKRAIWFVKAINTTEKMINRTSY